MKKYIFLLLLTLLLTINNVYAEDSTYSESLKLVVENNPKIQALMDSYYTQNCVFYIQDANDRDKYVFIMFCPEILKCDNIDGCYNFYFRDIGNLYLFAYDYTNDDIVGYSTLPEYANRVDIYINEIIACDVDIKNSFGDMLFQTTPLNLPTLVGGLTQIQIKNLLMMTVVCSIPLAIGLVILAGAFWKAWNLLVQALRGA